MSDPGEVFDASRPPHSGPGSTGPIFVTVGWRPTSRGRTAAARALTATKIGPVEPGPSGVSVKRRRPLRGSRHFGRRRLQPARQPRRPILRPIEAGTSAPCVRLVAGAATSCVCLATQPVLSGKIVQPHVCVAGGRSPLRPRAIAVMWLLSRSAVCFGGSQAEQVGN